MRIRSVKPEFHKDRVTGRWDDSLKLFYIGLWNFADDDGRFEWEPDLIRSELYPYDPSKDVGDMLDRLRATGRVVSYTVEGQRYGAIPRFREHQHPERPRKSTLPAFADECTDAAPTEQCNVTDPAPTEQRNSSAGLEGNRKGIGGEGKRRTAAPPSPEALDLAAYLLDAIRVHTPDTTADGEDASRWAKDIDLALRADGRTPEAIRAVIDFAHRSPAGAFWRPNIRSGKKLREKFETLRAQAEGRGAQGGAGWSIDQLAQRALDLEAAGK